MYGRMCFFQLTAGDYGPSQQGSLGSETLNNPATSYPQPRTERHECMHTNSQLPFPSSIQFRTQVQEITTHSGLGLPTSINIIRQSP